MRCKVCGAELPDGAAFCGECGSIIAEGSRQTQEVQKPEIDPIPEPPVPPPAGSPICSCPNCGFSTPDNKAFCPQCGTKMEIIQPVTNGAAPRKNKSNTFLIVLISILGFLLAAALTVVVILFVMNNKSNTDQDTVTVTSMPIATSAPAVTPTPRPITTSRPVATAAPAPTTNNGDYLFPSDTQYITEADLVGRSQEEVRLMINEIYARNGYIFNNQDYQRYFSSKSWYVPISNSQPDAERRFNEIELANKNFLANYEKQRGWR